MTRELFIKDLQSRKIDYYISGENIMINCPFHGESNPSLGVHFGKNKFHCFSCGEAGGIVKLIRVLFDREDVKREEEYFEDSVNKESLQGILAELENVSNKSREKPSTIKILINFNSELYERPFGEYLDYLKRRKILNNTIEDFDLRCGWWKSDKRILIPVRDEYGRLVSVTGRSIVTDNKLFKIRKSKGADTAKVLFGLYNLRRKHITVPKTIFVVEGEFDVMYLQQNGIPAVCLGTKRPSDVQMSKLSHFNKVNLALDGDVGEEEYNEISSIFREYLDEVSVFKIPDMKDPNELSPKEVREIFKGGRI